MIEEMKREMDLLREPGMEFIVKDAGDSNEQQIEDIRILLEMGIDLLIVSPNEAEPLTPIIEEIYDSGIPVINIDRKIISEKFSAFIGADNVMIGREAGEFAARLLNNSGRILEITGLEGSSAAMERSKGFREVLDQHQEVGIDNYEGEWLHERALEVTDSLFAVSRNYDLIFAHNDPMALGSYLSAEKYNYHPFILGIDGLNIENGGIEKVLDGSFSATFLYPTGGDKAIQLALQILHDEPYKKYNFLNTLAIDVFMARTMKLQGDRISEQRGKIDTQLDYIGALDGLLKQKNNYLMLNTFISILLAIIVGLSVYLLVQKNKLYLAVDGKNRMIKEQNARLSEQRDNLVKLLKIAEEANEEKLRFFTNISHEFRSLISLITLPVNRLLETEIPANIRDKLLVTSKNGSRLHKLAQEILRFRKIDTNRYELNFQESDLAEFINEVVEAFEPKAEEKEIVLAADLPPKLIVEFDISCMEKVMYNLISNAVKNTDKGGIIYIKLEQENSHVRIDVKDTGRGIPKAEMPLIFDRFYRGANSPQDEDTTGMGIGLALTKELLSIHGGTINVKSKVGKGSTFTIQIPTYRRNLAEDEDSVGSVDSNAIEHVPDLQFHMDKTVLVVEDNAELRCIISELVGKHYKVEEASDGLDGFQKAIDAVPDLIISDILMPVMDGIQMARDLKKHPSTYHIPIILLSAIDSEESLIKGFNTGADAYIVKPFNESLLIRRIQNLIDAQSRIKNKYGQYSFSAEELNIEDHSSKEFINKLIKVIQENASSENHSLDKIAEDMNLSRSSLYRKIKDMTGIKAIDFMKKVRLQFAAKLLINRDYTVNEVAWRTGFSDTKYFSKCFYKEYGLVPSKFRSGRSA